MATPAPSLFELAVRSTPVEDEHEVVAEWRRPDEPLVRRSSTTRIDPGVLRDAVDAVGYGEALGRMVFTGPVRELFSQARADPGGLRVLLTVEAPQLRALRWERLAGPFEDGRWRLLSHSQRTPLSLALPSGSDRRYPPIGRDDLRALVVVANPEPDNRYRVEPFDEAGALDTVLEGLGEIPSRVLGKDPRAQGPATLAAIIDALTTEHFTILHLAGHGAFAARREG
ncbi:MAG: CHAT domain-containing protein, partial [Myxococcales bacterium]|nr:CHAT domain-containing protein [Myxococcales bacterium]